MEMTKIHELARQLKDAHGDKAAAEAAQKAAGFEASGDQEQAKTWRRIEAALQEMMGPRES